MTFWRHTLHKKFNEIFWQFGRHIFIDKGDVPHAQSRTKQVFDKKFGTDHDYKEGVEYLNGLWGWAKIDDLVFERLTKYNPNIVNFTITWWKKVNYKKKFIKKNVKNVVGGTFAEQSQKTNYDYNAIRDNLNNFPDSTIANPQSWGGIIRACVASGDKKVYMISFIK